MTEIMNFKKRKTHFINSKWFSSNLFDFHCTPLMIKFTELNNDNTLTKIQYFFFILKTIYFFFISFWYQFLKLSTRKVIYFYEYNSIDTLKWSLNFLRLLAICYFLFLKKWTPKLAFYTTKTIMYIFSHFSLKVQIKVTGNKRYVQKIIVYGFHILIFNTKQVNLFLEFRRLIF